jgi:hypothetical protein
MYPKESELIMNTVLAIALLVVVIINARLIVKLRRVQHLMVEMTENYARASRWALKELRHKEVYKQALDTANIELHALRLDADR